jgi:hypothetical protein
VELFLLHPVTTELICGSGSVGAVWTSLSNPGLESIRTSAFRCPTLRLGGRKNGFFLRNDADVPLTVCTGNHHFLDPIGGMV